MNYSPSPTYGSYTATGMVPGQITPPNPAQDLAAQYPNLGQTNAAVSGNILAGLAGQLSQSDLNYMQDQAAGQAVGSGMPGTNVMRGTLMGNKSARDIGMMQYQLQQNAINNYAKIVPTVSQTQTLNPALQAEIAGTNAVNAAAPNPQQSQSYAQQLYDQYLQQARGPGGGAAGGPAGGTGGFRMTGSSGGNPPIQPSPGPSYPPNQVYGATGGDPNLYPGYTWDQRSGQYVAQPQSPVTGNTGVGTGAGSYYAGPDLPGYQGDVVDQSIYAPETLSDADFAELVDPYGS